MKTYDLLTYDDVSETLSKEGRKILVSTEPRVTLNEELDRLRSAGWSIRSVALATTTPRILVVVEKEDN